MRGSRRRGKTTVAAALALGAAMRGRRVLCLTIDPAKRLADTLASRLLGTVDGRPGTLRRARAFDVPGSLSVLVIDTKSTFDEIVTRNAKSPEARDRILNNRLYNYVSTSLAGTQSYMAMEKGARGQIRPALRSHRPRHAADQRRAGLPGRARAR